ncbi:LOW QUALITY PROTEIN: hypothetical protein U9M48_018751 [Paspalum notatum var. saurae]|uniref:Biogenesis of lysosome-related organelles complex 1 subunit 1 n=1 Tax=Paspalum notatum var. saurae TaxID=547442 RepID=A0AAQ3WQ40_PASNO
MSKTQPARLLALAEPFVFSPPDSPSPLSPIFVPPETTPPTPSHPRPASSGSGRIDGAKPVAAVVGGKQDLEEALLRIVHQQSAPAPTNPSARASKPVRLSPSPIHPSSPPTGPNTPSLDLTMQSFHLFVLRAGKAGCPEERGVANIPVDTIDGGVQKLFLNECIELEARALLGTIARYRKQVDLCLPATNEISSALKEIRDFENWMKIMHFDRKSINTAIHNIHQSWFSLQSQLHHAFLLFHGPGRKHSSGCVFIGGPSDVVRQCCETSCLLPKITKLHVRMNMVLWYLYHLYCN